MGHAREPQEQGLLEKAIRLCYEPRTGRVQSQDGGAGTYKTDPDYAGQSGLDVVDIKGHFKHSDRHGMRA